MPKNDPELGMKQGKASDLKEAVEEILEQLILNVLSLENITPESMDIFKPEVDKAVYGILDVVSNTIIMDPH